MHAGNHFYTPILLTWAFGLAVKAPEEAVGERDGRGANSVGQCDGVLAIHTAVHPVTVAASELWKGLDINGLKV